MHRFSGNAGTAFGACTIGVLLVALATFLTLSREGRDSFSRLVAGFAAPQVRPPFYRDSEGLCGDGAWLREYGALHARLRNERVLVSVGVGAGIGDRLSGAVAEFFWAVLTGRSFIITSYLDKRIPPWDAAVRPPAGSINWRGNESEWPLYLSGTLHYHAGDDVREQKPHVLDLDATGMSADYAQVYWMDKTPTFFLESNLSDVFQSPANMSVVARPCVGQKALFVASNRGGVTTLLLRNPRYARRLRETMGLQPSTAWTCGFRTLFEPTDAVLDAYGPMIDRVRALNGRCIAVTVRTGDDAMRGANKSIDDYADHFACAEKVSRDLQASEGGSPVDVPWLVNSDSRDVRAQALARWGPARVIVDAETAYSHGDCVGQGHSCDEATEARAAIDAFGSFFAMSLCQHHVFHPGSGFARSAAFAAREAKMYPFVDGCFPKTPEVVAARGSLT